MRRHMAKKTKKVKKAKEHVEMVFVNAVLNEAKRHTGSEYLYEMSKIGVPTRELARAQFEFTLDLIFPLLMRLNDSERKLLEKQFLAYCKSIV
jgi:predicted ABC-class ATPase